MAAIDKSLPNVRQTIKLPNPQEVQKEQQEQTARNMMQPPVDVQKNEDGSVDVSFDPRAVNPGESKEHFANLAELQKLSFQFNCKYLLAKLPFYSLQMKRKQ